MLPGGPNCFSMRDHRQAKGRACGHCCLWRLELNAKHVLWRRARWGESARGTTLLDPHKPDDGKKIRASFIIYWAAARHLATLCFLILESLLPGGGAGIHRLRWGATADRKLKAFQHAVVFTCCFCSAWVGGKFHWASWALTLSDLHYMVERRTLLTFYVSLLSIFPISPNFQEAAGLLWQRNPLAVWGEWCNFGTFPRL